MRNSVIFTILFLFLGATVFFWVQVLKVEELPPATPPTPSSLSGAEATSVINLAMELLIDNREPLPYLSGRDPFSTDDPEAQSKVAKAKPHNSFVLSSVIYNDTYSLAVINGEILAEGDIISNEMAEYEYIVENIEVDEVEVSDGEESYTLNVISESYKR